ncbi:hypothetical protein [Nonomuraea dietziae]|uniref:hypothetical protein n=1 Tax=Nonomuraea dietziae TaxID=65515 RepID=UPI0031DF8543
MARTVPVPRDRRARSDATGGLETGEPGPGEVRIRVEAIGVNRAEALFRAR